MPSASVTVRKRVITSLSGADSAARGFGAAFGFDSKAVTPLSVAPAVLGLSFPPVGEPTFRVQKFARQRHTASQKKRRQRRERDEMLRTRRLRGQTRTGIAA